MKEELRGVSSILTKNIVHSSHDQLRYLSDQSESIKSLLSPTSPFQSLHTYNNDTTTNTHIITIPTEEPEKEQSQAQEQLPEAGGGGNGERATTDCNQDHIDINIDERTPNLERVDGELLELTYLTVKTVLEKG